MYNSTYRAGQRRVQRRRRNPLRAFVLLLILGAAGYAAFTFLVPTPIERAIENLKFDGSVTTTEQQTIRSAIQTQAKTYSGSVDVSATTATEAANTSLVLSAYVPVTNKYSPRQQITVEELSTVDTYILADMDPAVIASIETALKLPADSQTKVPGALDEMKKTAVTFIPADQLTANVKLLSFEGGYYLDDLTKGALFRSAAFSGEGAPSLSDLGLNPYKGKDSITKVNMSGVTAFTRLMMKKLSSVPNATYFSEKIGPFLADADITHVSNEVSFKAGCAYSSSVFCSPPEMIEALKASGVDLVEITGNHNNDVGNQFNTDTINLYKSLGWNVFGGGINAAEAAKPHVADIKGTKLAFLGYNYPDSPNGGAIAKTATAGANGFDYDRIQADIAAAKQQADFVIVSVQFWECYAYPEGYLEFPQCDVPIPNQKEVFRKIADLGAQMIVGSSAHQPQTYEVYNDTPIYYGLGNMYLDQVQWPGTERGIILSNYFIDGKHVQTRLSPTVYGDELQTRLMDDADAVKLLERLDKARETAGLL